MDELTAPLHAAPNVMGPILTGILGFVGAVLGNLWADRRRGDAIAQWVHQQQLEACLEVIRVAAKSAEDVSNWCFWAEQSNDPSGMNTIFRAKGRLAKVVEKYELLLPNDVLNGCLALEREIGVIVGFPQPPDFDKQGDRVVEAKAQLLRSMREALQLEATTVQLEQALRSASRRRTPRAAEPGAAQPEGKKSA